MSFFDRFHKQQYPKAAAKVLVKEKKVTDKAEEKELVDRPVGGKVVSSVNDVVFRLLKKPHVSEKASSMNALHTYVFDVALHADKVTIKKAIESLYKVKVTAVRTIRHAGKPVYRGNRSGARSDWKKALVTIKKDQTINLFEGV